MLIWGERGGELRAEGTVVSATAPIAVPVGAVIGRTHGSRVRCLLRTRGVAGVSAVLRAVLRGTVYFVSSVIRQCSRTACQKPAVATLTYVYADQTAVLGPLAVHSEPHSYDLCRDHAEGLTVPRGWDVVRLCADFGPDPQESDGVGALVDAVNTPDEIQVTDDYVSDAPTRTLRVVPPH